MIALLTARLFFAILVRALNCIRKSARETVFGHLKHLQIIENNFTTQNLWTTLILQTILANLFILWRIFENYTKLLQAKLVWQLCAFMTPTNTSLWVFWYERNTETKNTLKIFVKTIVALLLFLRRVTSREQLTWLLCDVTPTEHEPKTQTNK